MAHIWSSWEVTPCVGVWIEMLQGPEPRTSIDKVTPCVGVWIEIGIRLLLIASICGHSLRGSVD